MSPFMAMELTSAQITEYLSGTAFASIRTNSVSSSTTASSILSKVSTSSITETLSLLSGSSERMDTILANLQDMKEIAQVAASEDSTEAERAEAYAKLRSLGAGIDTVISETKFNSQLLLNGTNLSLNSAGLYGSMIMSDLTTTGTDGLNLADQSANAKMMISYDSFCEWNNAEVDLVGLNISELRFTGKVPDTEDTDPYSIDNIMGKDTASITYKELETGQYQIEVVYAGKNSSVIITDNSGKELSRADKVDLSGSGIETVAFDVGIEMDIEKTQDPNSLYDKYDYESKGSASLYANLDYVRVSSYDLAGSAEAGARGVTLGETSLAKKDSEGDSLSITSAELGIVSEGKSELSSGNYKVEVSKFGDNINAILYDSRGRAVGAAKGTTLDAEGNTALDFGNGLIVNANAADFDGNATMTALVGYEQASNAYDDFDFGAYIDNINAAITMVSAQQNTVDKAYSYVNTIKSALNGSLEVSGSTSSLIKDVLGGGTTYSNSYSLLWGTSSSSSSSLSYTSSLILSNLSSSLGVQSGGTSLASLLGGTTSSLDPTKLPTNISLGRI